MMQPTQAAADRGGARRIDVVAPRSQLRLSDGLAGLYPVPKTPS